MMKALLLNGSPRRGGNTEVLLDALAEGVRSAGGEVEMIRLAELRIAPCINCGGCDQTGICIIQDDAGGVYEKVDQSRRIVLASPIYFYGITAQAKAFVDRAQSSWSRKRIQQRKGEWRDDPHRLGFFVSVAATKGEKVFDGAELTAKYFFDAIGAAYGGALLFRGIEKRGDMEKDAAKLRQAVEFGRRIIA
ncbi:MAG: flavodoxin family protein [Deltaproteobacteria bacterium]|nr:flavodoxin family protein [Deltaproteobacteria bacterium]